MRILHTMIRVGELQRSIDFYTQVLGMKLLRKADYPGGRFTNASSDTMMSRAQRCSSSLTIGTPGRANSATAMDTSIEVPDDYRACEDVKQRGGKVTREARPMKHGTTVIAFVEDPDGYKIELIQRKN
ncbi:MAG TPA: VOC family protein [Burkholderiales bacterium]|nr:VOC family protein [Burkholderiales bacterium]